MTAFCHAGRANPRKTRATAVKNVVLLPPQNLKLANFGHLLFGA